MYTIDDYRTAKAELAALNKRWEGYSGNNPDKYQAQIEAASSRVRTIEQFLKEVGILDRTPLEVLERKLDDAFPNARSKQIVEFEGKRFMRRFVPLRKSRSGKSVAEWGKSWEEVPSEKDG